MTSLKRATLPKLWISRDAIHGPEVKLCLPCGLSNLSRKIWRCVSWHHAPFTRIVGLDPDLTQIAARRVVAHHGKDEGFQVGFRDQYHSRSCLVGWKPTAAAMVPVPPPGPFPPLGRRSSVDDVRFAAHLCRDGSSDRAFAYACAQEAGQAQTHAAGAMVVGVNTISHVSRVYPIPPAVLASPLKSAILRELTLTRR